MSLFTTLAHRIQATPGLSTVYSWGQQAGTRLQPAYQDASQRVQQVSQQTRPVVDDARRRVSSAGTYVVERVAPQPKKQVQTPQPQEATQVAIVKTQPPAVVQSIQPCHQPEQQKPPLTLTSFVVGATKGAQDASQRFAERHPGVAKVVHAPLERMATTIHKDKALTQTRHETAQKEAADIDYNKATIMGREVDTTKVHEATTGIYKAGADTSGRIRMEGWKSAEYYRKEMQSTPTIAKHLGTIAIVGTTAASRVPEFVGMLPGGLETMAHRPDLIPTAVAIGAYRATFGTAEEFIHHPVQTSADIGAFMVGGGGVKGGVSRAGRVGRGITQPRATAETPMTWIHRPSQVKAPTKVQQIKSTLGAKKQQVVDRIKPTSSATPEYTVQKIGGKEVLAPAPRSLYDRTYHSVERKIGRVGAVAVAAKNAVSQFKPPRIQVVKTVKGFKSAETTTPSTTASSVKPVHKTRIAINKEFPLGKQDISGTYDVSFKQRTSKSYVPKVKGQKYTEKTEGTGQQVIKEHTTPKSAIPMKKGFLKRKEVVEVVPEKTTYVSEIVPKEITKTTTSKEPFIESDYYLFGKASKKPKPPSELLTVKTSKTKLIKDKSFESSTDWVKGKYLSKDKSARAIEVGGGKQPTFKETISTKGQLIAGKIAEKIPVRKSKASGDRTITLQEVKDKTMGSPQQKESGMFGSEQLTIAKQESTSALKHKGEVVSQVKDVSLNVNLAPSFSTFAATSSGVFASTIKAGAISHGYDDSDYDYSSVYPSSAFVPAVIRSQEATGFENIQATSIVPIAATWQPTNIVPMVMQKPVRQAVHEVVPVQRTRVGNVPGYINVTNQFNTQVPRTDIAQLIEIVPIQGESAITRQDEIQITDTVQKQDTVLIPDFMPPSLMPPIEIPIFGKGDGGFLKKKKKKKAKVAPQKQHKIRAWYPAALESVTAEQFQTGGKLTPHIAPAKTTRDLMREFIQTGRGIPTAKQHKARGN